MKIHRTTLYPFTSSAFVWFCFLVDHCYEKWTPSLQKNSVTGSCTLTAVTSVWAVRDKCFHGNSLARICMVSATMLFEYGLLDSGELGQIFIWYSSSAVLFGELLCAWELFWPSCAALGGDTLNPHCWNVVGTCASVNHLHSGEKMILFTCMLNIKY